MHSQTSADAYREFSIYQSMGSGIYDALEGETEMNGVENGGMIEEVDGEEDNGIVSEVSDIEGSTYCNGIKEEATPYPSWCIQNGAPINKDEIWQIFLTLGNMFGFQSDSQSNIYDLFMTLLDSRSSRMSCKLALLSLHADYIGGEHSNYKKWYFAAHFELDENVKVNEKQWRWFKDFAKFKSKLNTPYNLNDIQDTSCLLAMEYNWRLRMKNYTDEDYIYQIALYLLIWGEANNLRFMPECICFIYKCAFDYFESAELDTKANEFEFQRHTCR